MAYSETVTMSWLNDLAGRIDVIAEIAVSCTIYLGMVVATIYYPTLGCDIQGFRAMGLSVQYWPRWFQDFPAIWLAVPFGANGVHLGICTLPEKSPLCVK